MIPSRDYYADKNGKLTDDPKEWAFQIATAGVFLDDRTAGRYGIGADTLVKPDEPTAPSLRVRRIETEPEPKAVGVKDKPQEPVAAEPEPEEPKAEKSKASVKVKRAGKGDKKK